MLLLVFSCYRTQFEFYYIKGAFCIKYVSIDNSLYDDRFCVKQIIYSKTIGSVWVSAAHTASYNCISLTPYFFYKIE